MVKEYCTLRVYLADSKTNQYTFELFDPQNELIIDSREIDVLELDMLQKQFNSIDYEITTKQSQITRENTVILDDIIPQAIIHGLHKLPEGYSLIIQSEINLPFELLQLKYYSHTSKSKCGGNFILFQCPNCGRVLWPESNEKNSGLICRCGYRQNKNICKCTHCSKLLSQNEILTGLSNEVHVLSFNLATHLKLVRHYAQFSAKDTCWENLRILFLLPPLRACFSVNACISSSIQRYDLSFKRKHCRFYRNSISLRKRCFIIEYIPTISRSKVVSSYSFFWIYQFG